MLFSGMRREMRRRSPSISQNRSSSSLKDPKAPGSRKPGSMISKLLPKFALAILLCSANLPAQPIVIPRIDQMPDRPSPYLMRDWKEAGRGYDSLILNFNLTGAYRSEEHTSELQ